MSIDTLIAELERITQAHRDYRHVRGEWLVGSEDDLLATLRASQRLLQAVEAIEWSKDWMGIPEMHPDDKARLLAAAAALEKGAQG